MNAQWIVSMQGALVNLRQCVSIEWSDGGVWATEAHDFRTKGERRTHLLAEGSREGCQPFLETA